MADEKIVEAVKKLRENSKKRNFSQSFDFIVNLKNIDTKKPEGKINEVLQLPNGRGKSSKVVIFSDSIKNDEYKVVTGGEIEKLGKNKREIKKLATSTDFFISEPKLMPIIGKNLGMVLAPRGKMPTLITGNANDVIKKFKNSTRLKVKDSPVIQCIVGADVMPDEKVAENIEAVMKFLEKKLPKGRNNIKNICVKLTMSKPVKIEV
jgi:large subunit ribosomal protein L1